MAVGVICLRPRDLWRPCSGERPGQQYFKIRPSRDHHQPTLNIPQARPQNTVPPGQPCLPCRYIHYSLTVLLSAARLVTGTVHVVVWSAHHQVGSRSVLPSRKPGLSPNSTVTQNAVTSVHGWARVESSCTLRLVTPDAYAINVAHHSMPSDIKGTYSNKTPEVERLFRDKVRD